jgi:hypothetical protein
MGSGGAYECKKRYIRLFGFVSLISIHRLPILSAFSFKHPTQHRKYSPLAPISNMLYIQSLLVAIVALEAAFAAPTGPGPCKDYPKDILPYRCDIEKRGVGYDYDGRPDSPTLGRRNVGYDYNARPDSPTLGGAKRVVERDVGYDYNGRPDSPTLGRRDVGYDYDGRPDSPTLGRRSVGYDYNARPDSPTLGGAKRVVERDIGYEYSGCVDPPL